MKGCVEKGKGLQCQKPGGGGVLPYIVSNGRKVWLVKFKTANKGVHRIRHQVYYLALMTNSRFDSIQIQDKLKKESDSL